MMIMWTTEEVERNNGHLLVIFYNGETRGSITLLNEDESVKWSKAISLLNSLPNKVVD
jgi:hypothetical protein